MSYNYPSHKFAIYLSDDGGSVLTFHALLEASFFSKHWIPFCKKFMVEPRSPEAYFAQTKCPGDQNQAREWLAVKVYKTSYYSHVYTLTTDGIKNSILNYHDILKAMGIVKITSGIHTLFIDVIELDYECKIMLFRFVEFLLKCQLLVKSMISW